VAYAQIPRALRSDKHRRAASWIESVVGNRVGDVAEVLAYHYTAALDLARALGKAEVAKELESPALRFLTLAGERALGLDTRRAETHLSRALELAGPSRPERPEVLVGWAVAAHHSGRHGEAAEALEEAVALFRGAGQARSAGRAMTTLANVMYFLGDAQDRPVAEQAVALLEADVPDRDLVAAYAEMTHLVVLSGDLVDGIGWAERTLALAADLGLEEPPKPLGYRGIARCWLGDSDGMDDLRRALELAVEQGEGREATVLHNNLASMLGLIEGPVASLAAYRQGVAFAEARGIAEQALGMSAGSLDMVFDLGSWGEVLEIAEDLTGQFEATSSVIALVTCRLIQARVLALVADRTRPSSWPSGPWRRLWRQAR
jgi:hypothetical protein